MFYTYTHDNINDKEKMYLDAQYLYVSNRLGSCVTSFPTELMSNYTTRQSLAVAGVRQRLDF